MAERTLHQHIVDQWIETAGPWADQPIGSFSASDWLPFAKKIIWHRDLSVDFRKVRGTTHPDYRDGMTWREFLSKGKRMLGKRHGLDQSPEYFDDPVGWHEKMKTSAGWSLYQVNGELFVDEGSHRSVIARMRAEEEGITAQRVPIVRELEIDFEAMNAARELRPLLRERQWLSITAEPKFRDGETETNEVFFEVTGSGLGTGYYGKPNEIVEIVRRSNTSYLAKLTFWLRAAADFFHVRR